LRRFTLDHDVLAAAEAPAILPNTAPDMRPRAAGVVVIEGAANELAGCLEARDRPQVRIEHPGAGVDCEIPIEG
jgi:hypothetical protein